MIVLLNGSFGVGKSTVAEALVQRLPDAMIFDPEQVGYMVRTVTNGVRSGPEDTDDFQDIALWRLLTVTVAEGLHRQYGRSLIVPMTLSNPTYFEQVRDGLAGIGTPLRHFCLVAPLETIQKRLLERGDVEGGWPWRKAEGCVATLRGPLFEEYVDTDNRSVLAVVEHILRRIDPDS